MMSSENFHVIKKTDVFFFRPLKLECGNADVKTNQIPMNKTKKYDKMLQRQQIMES